MSIYKPNQPFNLSPPLFRSSELFFTYDISPFAEFKLNIKDIFAKKIDIFHKYRASKRAFERTFEADILLKIIT